MQNGNDFDYVDDGQQHSVQHFLKAIPGAFIKTINEYQKIFTIIKLHSDNFTQGTP